MNHGLFFHLIGRNLQNPFIIFLSFSSKSHRSALISNFSFHAYAEVKQHAGRHAGEEPISTMDQLRAEFRIT
jgi:hypothetical protein